MGYTFIAQTRERLNGNRGLVGSAGLRRPRVKVWELIRRAEAGSNLQPDALEPVADSRHGRITCEVSATSAGIPIVAPRNVGRFHKRQAKYLLPMQRIRGGFISFIASAWSSSDKNGPGSKPCYWWPALSGPSMRS